MEKRIIVLMMLMGSANHLFAPVDVEMGMQDGQEDGNEQFYDPHETPEQMRASQIAEQQAAVRRASSQQADATRGQAARETFSPLGIGPEQMVVKGPGTFELAASDRVIGSGVASDKVPSQTETIGAVKDVIGKTAVEAQEVVRAVQAAVKNPKDLSVWKKLIAWFAKLVKSIKGLTKGKKRTLTLQDRTNLMDLVTTNERVMGIVSNPVAKQALKDIQDAALGIQKQSLVEQLNSMQPNDFVTIMKTLRNFRSATPADIQKAVDAKALYDGIVSSVLKGEDVKADQMKFNNLNLIFGPSVKPAYTQEFADYAARILKQ